MERVYAPENCDVDAENTPLLTLSVRKSDSEECMLSDTSTHSSGSGSARTTAVSPAAPAAEAKSSGHHLLSMVVMSMSFFFTFTAYNAMQSLQASLNTSGKTCLAVLYGVLVVSCFLTPPIVQRLSPKVTIAIGLIVHCLWTGANFYPQESGQYLLVSACGLLGFASAPLWTSQQTYLTTRAHLYHQAGGAPTAEQAIGQFNSIFFLIFQATQIFGNLISSLVLQDGVDYDFNSTTCNVSSGNSTVHDTTRYTLLSVYLACGVTGVVLCLGFLKPLTTKMSQYVAKDWKSTCLATFRRMMDPFMLLLIPITVYGGMEQAFIYGEFTKHYITDCFGIGWIGYIMLALGVVDGVFSSACGKIAERVGRPALVVFASALNGALLAFLLSWGRKPVLGIMFAVASLWGIADAIYNTQLSTVFGVIFSEHQEAAFANYRLWQSIGFSLSFAYGDALDISVKLWILVGMLGISMMLYLMAEVRHRRGGKATVQ